MADPISTMSDDKLAAPTVGQTAGPVVYATRLVPDYRVPVLQALDKALNNRLVVASGRPPADSSLEGLVGSTTPAYSTLELPVYWILGETFQYQRYDKIFRDLDKPQAIIAEESIRSASYPLLLSRAKRAGVPVILWGHFSSNNRVPNPSRSLRDRYRISLARSASACVCYTDGIRDGLAPYVAPERLFVARNTVDLSRLAEMKKSFSSEDRRSVYERLQLPDDVPLIVYLGRLIPVKRPDLIVETFIRLNEVRPTALAVIGDGPERVTMERAIPDNLKHLIRFVGACIDEREFGPYLLASRAAINPGRLGLSVNHCFGAGVPVVSIKSSDETRYHSPEGEYVIDGYNGRLVNGLNAESLAAGVTDILDDHERYSNNAFSFASSELTLGQMVDGIVQAVRFATGESADDAP